MGFHVKSALFLYVPETEELIDKIVGNPFDTQITPVALQDFLDNPGQQLQQCEHVVIAAPLNAIKSVLAQAMEHDFSVGLIPTSGQKDLRNCYGLPKKANEALDIALREDATIMDVILCNKKIIVFKATVGRLPLIDSNSDVNLLSAARATLRSCSGIKLLPFQFKTDSGGKIKTAASGCMIVQRHESNLASKLISHDSSLTDGMISMVITAPISIIDYFKFLIQAIRSTDQRKKVPSAIGYIKSSKISIETETPFDVSIDGEKATRTPLVCETVPRAIRVNVGKGLRKPEKKVKSLHGRIEVKNLPAGRELVKAENKRIPFFSYASEERFRDLFISLRQDARITPSYVVLIVLSTMLATVGLYQSSTAVVIGAMLLAPLMAPIVSLAMGLLRQDTKLSQASLLTIAVGILIALSAAILISLSFPHKPITVEMQARLNPSLLDLAVAIVAGVAGAYTKSHKEILQSLAGVSIAVALVPPLAVAGIGLGMRDLSFFAQAFLLFSTNLIGITLAATLTFRMLGYSPVVRNMRGFTFVALLMAFITIPLFFSYRALVKTTVLEKDWQQQRFLVNDKYLIVKQARFVEMSGNDLLFVKVLIREPLTRNDLNQLRRKLQTNFTDTLDIRVQAIFIP
jgi:uncharacterized hydrophobic protein (TIGR00271 family)